MLHNTTTRAHFVECRLWRQRDYINETGYRGAPVPPPQQLHQSDSTTQYMKFRGHIWYSAAGSLRVNPAPLAGGRAPPAVYSPTLDNADFLQTSYWDTWHAFRDMLYVRNCTFK